MKTIQPTVYIVLGVHNELEYVKRLLSCVDAQTYKKYKLVIVDDGSTDGTDIFIKKSYPDAILIKGNGNLWWTGSLFTALEEVLKIAHDYDFVLIINNDCTFAKNLISILLETYLNNKKSIIGSLAIDSKDRQTVTDGGVTIDWSNGRLIPLGPKFISEISRKTDTIETDTLSTKGTLYPIDVFREVGNFDKKHLPHYVSDYEFSIRANRCGFRLILSYKAVIYNETKRTGIGVEIPSDINLTKALQLLFSRRSRMNIIDHFWFVTLCCPVKYKLKNYLLLFFKPFFMLKVLLFSKR